MPPPTLPAKAAAPAKKVDKAPAEVDPKNVFDIRYTNLSIGGCLVGLRSN